jgi:hypothetical protein
MSFGEIKEKRSHLNLRLLCDRLSRAAIPRDRVKNLSIPVTAQVMRLRNHQIRENYEKMVCVGCVRTPRTPFFSVSFYYG